MSQKNNSKSEFRPPRSDGAASSSVPMNAVIKSVVDGITKTISPPLPGPKEVPETSKDRHALLDFIDTLMGAVRQTRQVDPLLPPSSQTNRSLLFPDAPKPQPAQQAQTTKTTPSPQKSPTIIAPQSNETRLLGGLEGIAEKFKEIGRTLNDRHERRTALFDAPLRPHEEKTNQSSKTTVQQTTTVLGDTVAALQNKSLPLQQSKMPGHAAAMFADVSKFGISTAADVFKQNQQAQTDKNTTNSSNSSGGRLNDIYLLLRSIYDLLLYGLNRNRGFGPLGSDTSPTSAEKEEKTPEEKQTEAMKSRIRKIDGWGNAAMAHTSAITGLFMSGKSEVGNAVSNVGQTITGAAALAGPAAPVVAVFGKLVEAVGGAINKFSEWNAALRNEALRLAEVSGAMAAVMSEAKIRQMHLDIQTGEATAGGHRGREEAYSRYQQAMQPMDVAWTNAKNAVMEFIWTRIAEALESINRILGLPSPGDTQSGAQEWFTNVANNIGVLPPSGFGEPGTQ